MQEAFEKLKGVDIFSLKSYMEPTGFGSFNGAWVMINEIFVNFFLFPAQCHCRFLLSSYSYLRTSRPLLRLQDLCL